MKFLISIIMVLLMINLFAQADDAKDQAVPGPVSATAKEIDASDIPREVKEGDAMAETIGLSKSPTEPEGTIPRCLFKDAKGRCVPMPTFSSIIKPYGVGTKKAIQKSNNNNNSQPVGETK
jgi:hypothetical protein